MKPSALALRDLWPAGVVCIALMAGCFAGVVLGAPWPVWGILGVGVIISGIGWLRCFGKRWALSDAVLWHTETGLYQIGSDYIVSAAAVDTEVERVLALWRPIVPNASVRGCYLRFMPYPFTVERLGNLQLAGHVEQDYEGVKGATCIMVGARPVLSETALGHEIGHVILIAARNDPSEEGLKAMADAHGVPY